MPFVQNPVKTGNMSLIKDNCVSGKGTHVLGILHPYHAFLHTFSLSSVGPCWTFSLKAVHNINITSQIW